MHPAFDEWLERCSGLTSTEEHHLLAWILKADYGFQNTIQGDLAVRLVLRWASIHFLTQLHDQIDTATDFGKFLGFRIFARDLSWDVERLLEVGRNSSINAFVIAVEEYQSYLKSALGAIQRELDVARRACGANSYTFYVLNQEGDYTLVLMNGVSIVEPMLGLLQPKSARDSVLRGEKEVFCEQTRPSFCGGATDQISAILRKRASSEPLYGDFATRENVQSYTRILLGDADSPEGIIFLNFCEPKQFDDSFRASLRQLAKRLEQLLTHYVLDDETGTGQWAVEPLPTDALLERDFLSESLRKCLEQLGLSDDDSLATLHLFHAESLTLQLVAHAGRITHPEAAWMYNVSRDNGVLPWVALKCRGLLIQDLRYSPFRPIYRPYDDKMCSELAVPMTSGGELKGILNIETSVPCHFFNDSVRYVWKYALALDRSLEESKKYYVKREADIIQSIKYGLAQDDLDPSEMLEFLMRKTKEVSGVDHVDLWIQNEEGVLELRAHTDGDLHDLNRPPREDGWTAYVRDQAFPTWIMIRDDGSCDGYRWNKSCWTAIDNGPTEVNDAIREKVRCELGMPLLRRGKFVGVLWLKHRGEMYPFPLKSFLNLVELFVESSAEVVCV